MFLWLVQSLVPVYSGCLTSKTRIYSIYIWFPMVKELQDYVWTQDLFAEVKGENMISGSYPIGVSIRIHHRPKVPPSLFDGNSCNVIEYQQRHCRQGPPRKYEELQHRDRVYPVIVRGSRVQQLWKTISLNNSFLSCVKTLRQSWQ